MVSLSHFRVFQIYFLDKLHDIDRSEVNFLKEKLENLEKKIIVGGENLLEKAEEQEKLLEASAQELEQRMTREEQLQRELEVKEVS